MIIWVYSFLSEIFFLSLFTQQIKIQVFSQLCRMLQCWFYCNAVNYGQCCCFQQEPRYATVLEIKGCIISWCSRFLFWWVPTTTVNNVTDIYITDMASFIQRTNWFILSYSWKQTQAKDSSPLLCQRSCAWWCCELGVLKLAGIKALGCMNMDHSIRKGCFLSTSSSSLEHNHYPSDKGLGHTIDVTEISILHNSSQNWLHC